MCCRYGASGDSDGDSGDDPMIAITIAAALTAVPAGPRPTIRNYPVCLQVYGRGGGYISCRYHLDGGNAP